jgi:hypothetical protein
MSDSVPFDVLQEMAHNDRKAYLEQRLFVFSPLNTFWTAVAIFVLLFGAYAVAAYLSGAPLIVPHGIGNGMRFALLFSLLIATVLGIQRFARVHERADFAAHAAVLSGGVEDAKRATALTPDTARLARATIIGIVMGGLLCWTIVPVSPPVQTWPTYIWFCAVTVLISVLFARGVTLTRGGARGMREMIDGQLVVDLLRIDRLSVIGRSAARGALVWFVISAVVCLFFIGGRVDSFTVVLLFGCAAMGVWIFVATMETVRRKIRAAKSVELERVRREIDVARTAPSDTLQGLLAYEARIMAVHEWPFDQTTLMRVGASALILAVPWFGQAVAAFVVERFADIPK